jgi:hypothetical protein
MQGVHRQDVVDAFQCVAHGCTGQGNRHDGSCNGQDVGFCA